MPTGRTCGPDFFVREFSVAVFVEFLEGLAGFREFVGVDDAVLIKVERFEEEIHGASTGAAAAGGALSAGRRVAVLGDDEAAGCADGQREDEDLFFHVGCERVS